MKLKILTFFLIFFTFFLNQKLFAEAPYFVDFKKILNQSTAGKKAQDSLKKKLENGIKKIKEKENKILSEEKKIIEQKKVVSNEDYKKKVSELRKKVSLLRNQRSDLMKEVADQRSKARQELLKNLNPILKEYMIEKKIRVILDKKNILYADDSLEITDEIMKRLNSKLKSIKID